MRAWIVGGTMLAGFLLGEVLPARAQGQAGRQVAGQAAATRQAAPSAQPAPAAPSATSAPRQAPPPQAPPPPSGPRRDPFRAIAVKGPATILPPNCTQPGKRSLLIGQLQLQGIARNVEGQWIAVVDNKTKRAYFLREKDELCNGIVTRITEESLALEERSVDSFGRTRAREIILQSPGP